MTILTLDPSVDFPKLWNVSKLLIISIVAEVLFTVLFIIIFGVFYQEDFSPYLTEISSFVFFHYACRWVADKRRL